MAGTTFDTTTGQIVPSMVDRYTGMDSDPMGRQYSNLLGNVQGALTDQDRFVNRRFRSAVDSSAIVDPNFDDSGKLLGFAANTGPFGSMVYTGMDNPNALPDTSDDADMVVAPLDNPMTNQPRCPDGYVFDDDLQACRLDVSGSSRQASTSDGDMFYRRTALDDAPANLPTGFDFDAANRRFTQSYGYRPDFYRSPMSLTGFTRLS
jgi:hypothetical protein